MIRCNSGSCDMADILTEVIASQPVAATLSELLRAQKDNGHLICRPRGPAHGSFVSTCLAIRVEGAGELSHHRAVIFVAPRRSIPRQDLHQ